ncbi:MAG: SDR family NAD(P)-dependent oxidoreductase, partial [Devosia sp.]
MVRQARMSVPHIDILYCNSSLHRWRPDRDAARAKDPMFKLNVNAVMKNVQSVVPHMIQRRTGDISV